MESLQNLPRCCYCPECKRQHVIMALTIVSQMIHIDGIDAHIMTCRSCDDASLIAEYGSLEAAFMAELAEEDLRLSRKNLDI